MGVAKVMAGELARAGRKALGHAPGNAAATSFRRYAKTLSVLGKDALHFHPQAGRQVRRVAANLLRGPAPTSERAFERLVHRHHINTIISLLDPSNPKERGLIALEKKMVRKLGVELHYLSMPFGTAPPKESVAKFLKLTQDKAKGTVFVHCRLGRDRTGTMVALFREAIEKWRPRRALAEMRSFGYNPVKEPYLAYLGRFVRSFGTAH